MQVKQKEVKEEVGIHDRKEKVLVHIAHQYRWYYYIRAYYSNYFLFILLKYHEEFTTFKSLRIYRYKRISARKKSDHRKSISIQYVFFSTKMGSEYLTL